MLNGAWWPRCRVAEDEVPLLARAVAHRFTLVPGISLHIDDWPGTDIAADHTGGVRTKVNWYGSPAHHLAVVHLGGLRRISLLVVPPNTAEDTAIALMLRACTPGNAYSARELLDNVTGGG